MQLTFCSFFYLLLSKTFDESRVNMMGTLEEAKLMLFPFKPNTNSRQSHMALKSSKIAMFLTGLVMGSVMIQKQIKKRLFSTIVRVTFFPNRKDYCNDYKKKKILSRPPTQQPDKMSYQKPNFRTDDRSELSESRIKTKKKM